MKVFIVYCHPSDDSFTKNMCDAFIRGITDAGHEYIISDLYKMGFAPVMTEQEYLRDANYKTTPEVADDVRAEQEKINSADAIAFIYPVFWTEAPAMLVGWFDRVWSYGFAYGDKTMKMLDKAIILCSAGNPIERLKEFGLLDSMKKVMLGDRLFERAKKTKFVVFDGTSREKEQRTKNWDQNLRKAYEEGKNLFMEYGQLTEFSYNLSSHGMMAGSSSGYSRKVTWNKDGSVILRSSSSGNGSYTSLEYKVPPETAKKLSDYVADKRLADLSQEDIPTVAMYDNFTSSTICMTYDNSASYTLNCGPAGYTFKTIESEISELLKECESAGECIKDEKQETPSPFLDYYKMTMGITPDAGAQDLEGLKQVQEAVMREQNAAPKTPSVPGNWICKCGTENSGKFCWNCGMPRE